jgi:mRNA interferase HigB
MYITTEDHLEKAKTAYKDAATALDDWQDVVEAARWHNIVEVREIYKSADPVDGYVVFNIRGNHYRLITVIHWAKTTTKKQTMGHVYIRSFFDAQGMRQQKAIGARSRRRRRNNYNERSDGTNSRRPGKDDGKEGSPCHP